MAQSIKLGNDTFLDITGICGTVRDNLPLNANLNNYYGRHKDGIYYIGDITNMQNAPIDYSMLLVMTRPDGNFTIQVIFYCLGRIYIRYRVSNGTWTAWKYVSLS